MFIRYLGGGIGHLQQFPPAHSDGGDMGACDNDSGAEVEVDDFVTEVNNEGVEGDEDSREDNDDDDDDDEGDNGGSEDKGSEDDDDLDEHYLDEEAGNVY
jgi:hypothetical protein